ncbi:PucR family transcriptional regulator [Streptomyces sp. JJ36]|uniref:PucR family transcriptional regulator n=1 Tax=Streptomyces sp. JJ36 TaxID=2736645 RepID=UPI001F28229C|nr:PucR family transcriptional regulator [Streptomyces sp. JJ36]
MQVPAGPGVLPPSVPVPLRVLLEDAGLGLRQLAGPRDPDVPVHAVHTSEMADPVPYLLGGELLLSAGVHRPEAAEGTGAGPGAGEDAAGDTGDDAGETAAWDAYVARTVQAGAAALGFGIAPVHRTVPPALVRACDRHGLPLLEVPRRTPFTAVARAQWQAAAERRHRALRELAAAQQSLAAAAARPHPVPAVLARLARHLGGLAVLSGPDGAELASAGEEPGDGARAELARLAAALRPAPSSASGAAGEWRLTAYALSAPAPGGARRLALGVCVPGGRGAPDDFAAGPLCSVAVALLSLLAAEGPAGAEADRSAALVRLLLGAGPGEVADLLAGPVGAGEDAGGRTGEGAAGARSAGEGTAHDAAEGAPETYWTVVHGRRRAGAPRQDGRWERSALGAALGTALIDLDGDGFRALLPGRARPEPCPGWTLGAGTAVPPEELARGDAEAARALRRARAERRAVVRGRPAEGVASLVDPEQARALARVRLAPLADRPELVETLRMWLSLHGSWDRTAVALEVHRNTVRQRVARAAGLLGEDLSDPDVRMELWFALGWR